jgi:hypothetical protein
MTRLQGNGKFFRSDCLECGRELLFPMLYGDHGPSKDDVRTFCSEACMEIWKSKEAAR